MLNTIDEESKLPVDFQRRRGYFLVTKDLLDFATADLMTFMGNFLIIRAEYLCSVDAMEYIALSRFFDPVEEGHKIPQYTFNITKKMDGSIRIFVEKVSLEEEGIKGTGLLRLLRKLDG